MSSRPIQPGDLVRSEHMNSDEFGLVLSRDEVGAPRKGLYPGCLTIVWYIPDQEAQLDELLWYDDELELISPVDGAGPTLGPEPPE
jgi:hypothetical protein